MDKGITGVYRDLFKSTSLFSVVQVSNVFVTIVRGKVLSVLLGTTGMGINGLLISATTLVKNVTSLGLPESSVKQIAIANSQEDLNQVSRVLSVFYRWVWVTIFLGVLVMLLFSPLLSRITFSTYSHWDQFAWLSLTILLGGLTSATHALMRGTKRFRYLAASSMLGSVLGLLVGIPFIFLLGTDGIVPSIVATSLTTYLLSVYFRKKMAIRTYAIPWKQAFKEGKEMAKLGIALSVTALLTTAVTFAVPAFIAAYGTVGDAGLYSTGVSLVSGYVGMVFNAMTTDYFPRLSASIANDDNWHKLVSQQTELVVLILAPILILLVTSAPLIIELLLTQEFLPILAYVPWAAFGLYLQGIVWAFSAIMIARGDYKILLYSEVVGQVVFVGFSMLGYMMGGLLGLGIGLLLTKLVSIGMTILIVRWKYKLRVSSDVYVLLLALMVSCLLTCSSAVLFKYPTTYFSGSILFMVASVFCLFHLNRRLNFKELAISLVQKFRR